MTHFAARRFGLRDGTAAAHAALDAAVGPLETHDGYLRYLRGIHRFRAGAEPLLAAEAWRPVPLVGAIEADMADLGVKAGPAVGLALPGRGSELLGVAYVLEGSSLGARLLARQAAALGLGPTRGARHLAAQTADRGAWQGFCRRLEAADPYDGETAAAAAAVAFAAALQAFADDAG